MINIKYSQFFVFILAFLSLHIPNDVPKGYSEEITLIVWGRTNIAK